MGYHTDFEGSWELSEPLDDKLYNFLCKLNDTRRMKRNVSKIYGEEGEFFVEGNGYAGQDRDEDIIDFNEPPGTQPSLWCQWRPTEDKKFIEWDGGEKFYEYCAWIGYLIEKILAPNGYVLNGEVKWQGEEMSDRGKITIKNNEVDIEELE